MIHHNKRILVIRGGAIGDFILTLPAIKLLKGAFGEVEILGHHHILQLVEGRYYTQKTRSIDAASLASFFNPNTELDSTWCAYFAGFQHVISYLFDPDKTFTDNLYRAGVTQLLQGSPNMESGTHAAFQLAQPLEHFGLFLKNPASRLFPSDNDHQACYNLLNTKGICDRMPFFVIHPGSGGKHKNWPISYWKEFSFWILQNFPQYRLFCVGGEADQPLIEHLASQIRSPRLTFFENLPLPILAALLANTYVFVGHDTGISHIAAATGARCLLLYGPTDAQIWAPPPMNNLVQILTSPSGLMEDLPLQSVCQAFAAV